MKPRIMTVAVLGALLGACASQPENIDAQYVSDRFYRDLSCQELQIEAEHVNGQASMLFSKLNKKANGDAAQMAVGMLLFWPALFFLEGGDSADAATYARLKGEMDAIQKTAHRTSCPVQGPTFGLVSTESEAVAGMMAAARYRG